MAKHECPDCGASHEMSTAGRIKRLEEKVRELEAQRHVCPHQHYYWWNTSPTIYPLTVTNGTAPWAPLGNTTVTYDSTTAPQFTLT